MAGREPTIATRGAIAEAVHRAVVEFTGADGYRHCFLYAVAGWSLAREVFGRDYWLQAGSKRLLVAPPDGWLYLNARPDGLCWGDFHCWFALEGPGGEIAELVDLSSRHYRRWADSNRKLHPGATVPIRWSWPGDPPPFVWQEGAHSDWLGLVAERPLTEAFVASVRAQGPGLEPLHRLARRHFQTAGG
jgi:hypothetical protein